MSAESFRKVSYDLRPAKQIERRILLDSFQFLAKIGLPVRDYTYVGFGSIYFYDFAMFYRYLGMKRMISLEMDRAIEKRVNYNRPFKNIEIRMQSAEQFIPSIDRDERYLIWFDYDYMVDRSNLSDVQYACNALAVGSLFLVTVDAYPPASLRMKPGALRKHVTTQLLQFLPDKYPLSNLSASNMEVFSRDVILASIDKGLESRPNVEFVPLWSIGYEDTRPMYTFGGVLADRELAQTLRGSCKDFYYRLKRNESVLKIVVPRLTRKERATLDHFLPGQGLRLVKNFGINSDELENYRTFHRYFPSYSELF
jgi:hypothetical protein